MKYKIDEVSKACGITKRTIRYYEEIGLLFPPERSEGGVRKYTDQHIERIKLIVSTREVLGISLQEVREFVDIEEAVTQHILDVRKTEDVSVKQQKLLELEKILERQLLMIDQKMQKIINIKEKTDQYYKRVREAILKYNQKKE